MSEQRHRFFSVAAPIALLFVVGLGFWTVGRSVSQKAALASPIGNLTVALSSTIDTAPLHIAEALGYFKELGITFRPVVHTTGKSSLESLLEGNVDIAVSGDVAFVHKSFEHPELRVISTLEDAFAMFIVGKKDRGITELADLRGKRIGITRGSASEFFVTVFLAKSGLTVGDVRLVTVAPEEMAEGLRRGILDAVSIWNPHAFAIAEILGENAVIWSSEEEQPLFFLLVSTGENLSKRSKIIERFMQATVRGEAFIISHPEEARRILDEKLRHAPSYSEAIWPGYTPRISLPQELLLRLEDQARWLMRGNFVRQGEIPNFLEFIGFGPLEKVKPRSVTIIH